MDGFQSLINLICGESTTFTPQMLVSFFVVVLFIDGIFFCVGNILRGGRK